MADPRAVCCCCCSSRQHLSAYEDISDSQTEQTRLLGGRDSHDHESLPHKDYESLDYDRCYNEPYLEMIEKQQKQDKRFHTKLELMRWVFMFIIGFSTAMVALFIDGIVKTLFKLKFGTVDKSIKYCTKEGCLALSLLMLLGFNVLFIIISSTITVLEPVAAGSGIPEIKCYLNGIKIPRVVRVYTLLAKAVGVLFSVAGGLFVGKEGPMIHSGAVIGAGLPQFESIAARKVKINFPYFRSDRDKRDFVSGGAAAGVAAAFGAPIGGVLFSLEEGSSFWNQKLTWRTFFCSMAATFSLNFFLSGFNRFKWGYFYEPGLIDFGEFKCSPGKDDCRLWSGMDLFIFLGMGMVGGLLGALFNSLNKTLTRYRMRHLHGRHPVVRVLEAVLVVSVTTTVAFVSAMTLGTCKKLAESNGTEVAESVRTYFCQNGYYNDMATLFFNSQETAIKQLFHQQGTFSMPSLAIFFMMFFFLACWTYGVSVPSGLFVPSLLCGAAYGRIVANILQSLGYTNVYSGTFALVGAGAFLGGVVRMTISLTVILIESTNQITYGLPIMIVLMVAKWFGDLFNEGLYDIHIELKNVPLLGWEAPEGMASLTAKDVMRKDLSYIYTQTSVQAVTDILSTTVHHAYPVVTVQTSTAENTGAAVLNATTSGKCSQQDDRHQTEQYRELEDLGGIPGTNVVCSNLQFEGMILRSQLISLLHHGVYYLQRDSPETQPRLEYDKLIDHYPRYPDVHDLDLGYLQQSRILDVRRYMNPCPYTCFPDTRVPQIFNLFRGMGLRHLPVISKTGQVQGMITRHNLTEEYLHKLQHRRHLEGNRATTLSPEEQD